MFRIATFTWFSLIFASFALQSTLAQGAILSENLLPVTTKGFVSIPSMDQLRMQWNRTQLGQLAQDPVMKPFADDLRDQIQKKLGQSAFQVGLTWADVDGVQNGEICLALIQPDGDASKHATALLVDVIDRAQPLDALLSKIDSNMRERGATKETRRVRSIPITVYTVPRKKEPSKTLTVIVFVNQEKLVLVNNEVEALAILSRFEDGSDQRLADLLAFKTVMSRCDQLSGDLKPLVRWFAEPLGYAHVVRAAAGGRKRRGTDILKVLSEQGFDAIQGVGGHINLATERHEVLHRTFIFAPPLERSEGSQNQDRYNLAFRMFDFPNGTGLRVQDWIPRELATYVTVNWKMRAAFEYSSTFVDGMLGEGFFEDFLGSLRDDINGPQIDIRKQLVAHLGERATVMSDNSVPITPQSERLILALEVTDAGEVAKNLDRALETDPYARRLQVNGQTIWEMLSDEEEETPAVVIDGIGLTPIPGLEDSVVDPEGEGDARILTNSAIAVVHGHLIVASHVDLMMEIVAGSADGDALGDSLDYNMVSRALDELGAGDDSLRLFSRTDEEYRATYELIRENRMPEARSLLGRVLNRLLGPEEEGLLREQQINGEKLPDYQVVRRYLGPAGLFVRTVDDGWIATGIMLTKAEEYDADLAPSAITKRPPVQTTDHGAPVELGFID